MADIVFNCQFCNESLIVDDRGVGVEVPCPHCLHKIQIPEDAVLVQDPNSIYEVEPPERPEEPKAAPNAKSEPQAESALATSNAVKESKKPSEVQAEPEAITELAEESTETVLALLESLLENQPLIVPDEDGSEGADAKTPAEKSDQPPPAEAPKAVEKKKSDAPSSGDAVPALEKRVIDAVTELKCRLDHMYQAYQEAGERVENLTQENTELINRIEAGEVERKGLSIRLDEFTQTVNLNLLAEQGSQNGSELPPLHSGSLDFVKRLRVPYKVAASLIFLSTIAAVYGLYKSVHNEGGATAQGGGHPTSDPDHRAAREAPPLVYRELSINELAIFTPVEFRIVEVREEAGNKFDVGQQKKLDPAKTYIGIMALLINTDPDQSVHLGYVWDDAHLEDDVGNVYVPEAVRVTKSRQVDGVAYDELDPGQGAEGLLVFEAPMDKDAKLTLVCRPHFWASNEAGLKQRLQGDGFRLTFNR